MESKRKIELFNLMLSNLINDKGRIFDTGICRLATNLFQTDIIGYYEKEELLEVLKKNKPVQNPDNIFFEFTLIPTWKNNSYWWSPIYKARETKDVRIAYLQKLISTF